MSFASRVGGGNNNGPFPPGSAFTGGSVTLASNGTCSGTSYSGPSNWFSPTTTSIGASYWARTTRTSGTGSVVFNPASGTWYSLSAGQTWSATGGAGGCAGTFELATDSGGANIVEVGTISVNNTL